MSKISHLSKRSHLAKRCHLAIALTLLGLQGCAAVLNVKLPPLATVKAATSLHVPESIAPLADAKVNVKTKTLPDSASSTLQLPASVSIKLPASLLDDRSAKVISNDGGSVISNDGGSVISNDGGSVISNDGGSAVAPGGKAFGLLADTGAAHDVAGFFHVMSGAYAISVGGANALLSSLQNPSKLAMLLAGKPVSVTLPAVVFAPAISLVLELKELPGQDALLTAYLDDDTHEEFMQVRFKDKQHGSVVLRFAQGLPGTGLLFASTFDLAKNLADVDIFAQHLEGYGRVRLRMHVSRPSPLVPGGPTLQIHVSTAEPDSLGTALPMGQVVATAYALDDGSAVAIFGGHQFKDPNPTATLARNDAASPDLPQAFFIDAAGNQGKSSAALRANVPPLTDIAAFVPQPDGYDLPTDAIFDFKK